MLAQVGEGGIIPGTELRCVMDYNCVVGRAKEARHSRQYLVSRISSSPSRWACTYRIANCSVGRSRYKEPRFGGLL